MFVKSKQDDLHLWDGIHDYNHWDASETKEEELCHVWYWEFADFTKDSDWWIGAVELQWGEDTECFLYKLIVNAGLDVTPTEPMVDMADEEDAAIGQEEDGLMTYIA